MKFKPGDTRDGDEHQSRPAAFERSQHDLARDLQSITRLHELAIRYVGSHDLNGILLEIVDAAIAITNAAKGNLQLFDPSAAVLRLTAAKGFSREWLDFFSVVAREAASCAQAMRTRQRVIVDDVRTRQPLLDRTETSRLKSSELPLATGRTMFDTQPKAAAGLRQSANSLTIRVPLRLTHSLWQCCGSYDTVTELFRSGRPCTGQ